MNWDLSFLFSMRGVVVVLVAVFVIIKILRTPHFGVFFFLFLIMVDPHEMEIFPGMETLPIVKIFVVITIISILFSREKCKHGFRFSSQQTLLFLLGIVLAISGSFSQAAIDYFIERFVPVLVIYVLIVNLLDENMRVRNFLLTYCLFTTYLSLYGIYNHEISGGHVFYDEGLDRIYYYGFLNDPNDLALVLVSALPLLMTFLHQAQSFPARLFFIWAFILHIVAILWTYSRGGFLGLATVLILYSLTSAKKVLAIGASILILFTMLAFSQSLRGRFIDVGIEDSKQMDPSAAYRLQLWEAGINMVKDNLFNGVGMGQFRNEVGRYLPADTPVYRARPQTAHNSFVLVAGEAGIPGLLLYVMFITRVMTGLVGIYRRYGHGDTPLAMTTWSRPLMVTMAGILTCGMFLSQTYNWFFYIFTAISDILYRNFIDTLQEASDERPEQFRSEIRRTDFPRPVF